MPRDVDCRVRHRRERPEARARDERDAVLERVHRRERVERAWRDTRGGHEGARASSQLGGPSTREARLPRRREAAHGDAGHRATRATRISDEHALGHRAIELDELGGIVGDEAAVLRAHLFLRTREPGDEQWLGHVRFLVRLVTRSGSMIFVRSSVIAPSERARPSTWWTSTPSSDCEREIDDVLGLAWLDLATLDTRAQVRDQELAGRGQRAAPALEHGRHVPSTHRPELEQPPISCGRSR